MAREYAPPPGSPPFPDFVQFFCTPQHDPTANRRYDEAVNAWVEAVLEKTKAMGHNGPLIGTRLGFGVADGCAQYVVFKTKGGVGLIHIPSGDAYRAHAALIRGINLADVKREAGRKKLFARIP